jgi:hypothetical protein
VFVRGEMVLRHGQCNQDHFHPDPERPHQASKRIVVHTGPRGWLKLPQMLEFPQGEKFKVSNTKGCHH